MIRSFGEMDTRSGRICAKLSVFGGVMVVIVRAIRTWISQAFVKVGYIFQPARILCCCLPPVETLLFFLSSFCCAIRVATASLAGVRIGMMSRPCCCSHQHTGSQCRTESVGQDCQRSHRSPEACRHQSPAHVNCMSDVVDWQGRGGHDLPSLYGCALELLGVQC